MEIKKRDPDIYTRLEKVGFLFNFGEDDSGLAMEYLWRGSGYYIDVGASDLVVDGEIKLKTRVTVAEIKLHSVVLSDGSELPADIVYASGYSNMNGWAALLMSQLVADKVRKVWGLGSDTTNDLGTWKGSSATCGSQPTRKHSGFTVAICISPALSPSFRRCN